MKWNVLDQNGVFLGVVDADSAEEALARAKADLPAAVFVEEKPEHAGHSAQ